MIRFANPGDHPRLKTLWADVFGDDAEAVNAYFALRHQDENMLVDVRDGAPIAMLSMLPVTLLSSSHTAYPARYIYAVATAEPYRGQGVSTALLEAAHAYMLQRKEAASVLVPAAPDLFAFYGNRGYTTSFYYDVQTVPAASLPPCPTGAAASACSAAQYTQLRDQAFTGGSLYMRWEESAVGYAMRTFAENGGVTRLHWPGGEACAAWESTDSGVLVRELALLRGEWQSALAILHKQLHAARYTLRLPQDTVPGATPTPFGMIRWLIPPPVLSGPPPYLSLAMD